MSKKGLFAGCSPQTGLFSIKLPPPSSGEGRGGGLYHSYFSALTGINVAARSAG